MTIDYSQFLPFFSRVSLPNPDSHKGENGKVLIVGGSALFHAASKWSLDVASKFVDMVFYASVPENNELVANQISRSMQQAKQEFWNGIVIHPNQIEEYAQEADVILIGPGMERTNQTAQLTHSLVLQFPDKKWVIDAGALQMIDPHKIPHTAILTPHQKELDSLYDRGFVLVDGVHKGIVILVKGEVDTVYFRQFSTANLTPTPTATHVSIEGGNSGMTKGGTGDVLAGVVAGLYATQQAEVAAVVASVANKAAGDALYQRVGPYFNASDLVQEVPKVLWKKYLQFTK